MSGVNKAIVVGHLGADPKVNTSPSGVRCATFSIATSEAWRDKQSGEREEHTDWHRVVVWNARLIDGPIKFLKKGSKVYVEGKMQTRKWVHQDGGDRWTTEIVLNSFGASIQLLDRKEGGPPPAGSPEDYGTTSTSSPSSPVGASKRDDMDDEIPF